MRVGIGVSTDLDHIKAVREAGEKAKLNLGAENIDFGLIFTTAEFGHAQVLQTAAKLIGPVPLLGASSSLVISENGPLKHGFLLMLFSLGAGVYFNAARVKDITRKTTLSAGEELGEQLLYGCKNVRRNLSIIFSSADTPEPSNLVKGMQEKLGRSFPLVGASLPRKIHRQENSIYFNAEILNNAACGVLWGGKLNFSLGVGHGWQPLGKPRYVTKAGQDTIYEIDGEPAANLYKEYFGKDINGLKRELKRLSVFYPLGIAVSERKEYLLRSVVSINDDGSLFFQGDVPNGSLIRLMISSKESCLESAAKAAQIAVNNLKGKEIKFALAFSSFSRHELLGRHSGQEISLVRNALGKGAPFAGIYTSVEQAPFGSMQHTLGETYFHNNSITVLAVAE